MGLSINDSVYSCLFFFLTGLHFFHLLLGLLLLSLLFWSCSFSIFFPFQLQNEEDKKKGVEDQGTEILYVTPSFFTPFPFFFQEVRERKREEE